MTRLLLLHGRDLDGQDPETIEGGWLSALDSGLAATGSPLRLRDRDADFIYYADTLEHLVTDGAGPRPPVTSDAVGAPAHEQELSDVSTRELRFLLAVAHEVLADAGVAPPVEASAALGVAAAESAVDSEPAASVRDLVREAVVRVLALLDAIPGLSATVILLFLRDVYAYLHDEDARAAVDDGVVALLPDDEPAVVVAHSLGTVVAYSVLARRAAAGLEVPLLLTMGCPLGIRAVRETFAGRLAQEDLLAFPPGVRRWVNARDGRDLLAMHGIASSFPPADAAKVADLDVDNEAPGHHSAAVVREDGAGSGAWTGYLATAGVAREIARELAPVS